MNIRTSRFIHREEVKEHANKYNDLSYTHPQARRGIEEGEYQMEEFYGELQAQELSVKQELVETK